MTIVLSGVVLGIVIGIITVSMVAGARLGEVIAQRVGIFKK